MSYQESRVVAYLFSILVGAGYYSYYLIQQVQLATADGNNISSYWGRTMLISIALTVVLTVVLTILVSIIQAVATRDEDPMLSDERDQFIELKADRLSFILFGIGFMIAMTVLAFGGSPFIMFNIFIYSLFGSAIASCLTQLFFYRRGF